MDRLRRERERLIVLGEQFSKQSIFRFMTKNPRYYDNIQLLPEKDRVSPSIEYGVEYGTGFLFGLGIGIGEGCGHGYEDGSGTS